MNIDLSKLSMNDLIKLKKDICKEQKDRGFEGLRLKTDSHIYDQLKELGLIDRLKSQNLDEESYEMSAPLMSFEKSVFKICDLTLNNYIIKEKERPVPGNPDKVEIEHQLFCNAQVLGDDMADEYLMMVSEIMDVVKKHYKDCK